ncbi:3'-5' exonuclease domain-containing protein 2 [Oceanidesulfovibrio indonesiensis]|uniref:3'-5' exonuclease n=1 Tax=Oceanidesulfovibrio indonesiensis TaxID=54767 RepID=A0A7M3MH72_9BACT|nr:3'-5' exonuclease [Oceanidesulfovibrio indonesiensis]TVM18291.1 3'-5' exonuclease domain-containing protein 2 [Oceanidesulfovibrio indonesiensis]
MHITKDSIPTLTKDEVNSLPLRRYEGPVEVVRTRTQLEASLAELESEGLLGFDTEKRPCFTKGHFEPTSLLQLATAEKVYIFQLLKLKLPTELTRILADPQITKTGIAVRDDLRDLKNRRNFDEAGFVDLADVARRHEMETLGLRNLVATFLGFRLSKKERCSNWARGTLTPQQITYAATDAWASRELYLAMERAGLEPIDSAS